MCAIAGKGVSIHVIVYYPETEKGKRELARCVAGVHADLVHQYIKKLNCPSGQKAQLLDAVVKSVSASETFMRE